MAEYMVDDSPLWYRGTRSGNHSGQAEATDLGLSASLRRDLQAWNDVFEQTRNAVFDDRDESRPSGAVQGKASTSCPSRGRPSYCRAGGRGRMSNTCVTGSATSDRHVPRAPVRERPKHSFTGVPSPSESELRSATLRPAPSAFGLPGSCRATWDRKPRSSSTLAHQCLTVPTISTEIVSVRPPIARRTSDWPVAGARRSSAGPRRCGRPKPPSSLRWTMASPAGSRPA